MAQGKKPPDPLHETDEDILTYIDIIDAIGQGATIDPDAPAARLTAIQIARVAESAVENNTEYLKGRVGEFRACARRVIESALQVEMYHIGSWDMLHDLMIEEKISTDTFTAKHAEFASYYHRAIREAAQRCSVILRDIEKARDRKGVKGRPPQARTADALSLELDIEMLEAAIQSVPTNPPPERKALTQAIRDTVRKYTQLGLLRRLGATDQANVEHHTKRLLDKLDRPPRGRQFGSSSIKRKSK